MEDTMALTRMWDFQSSPVPISISLNRLKFSLINITQPPWSKVVESASPKERWVVYFCYLPESMLSKQHIHTLQRIREQSLPVLLVCAIPEPTVGLDF